MYVDNEDVISVPNILAKQSYQFVNWPNVKSIAVKCKEKPISQRMHTILYADLSGKCDVFIADYVDPNELNYPAEDVEFFWRAFKEISPRKYLDMKRSYDLWCTANVNWHDKFDLPDVHNKGSEDAVGKYITLEDLKNIFSDQYGKKHKFKDQ